MQDLNDFVWFVKVVEHGGFAAAGRALDQPKSKLSRRIAQLEERLGVRLIQRTTRQFAVTEVGQTFYQHCKAMLVEAEAAEEAVAALQAEPRGMVGSPVLSPCCTFTWGPCWRGLWRAIRGSTFSSKPPTAGSIWWRRGGCGDPRSSAPV